MLFQKILAPTDLSEPSFLALRQAMSLAKQVGAELTLLRVVSNSETDNGETELDIERRHFDDVVRDYSPPDLVVKTLLRQGDIVSGILQTARDGNFDLIVMATHGATGWREFALGSVTDEVVRMASCPVLTIGSIALQKQTSSTLSSILK
jgi:nucleotide-binding universal stress UspA family protein